MILFVYFIYLLTSSIDFLELEKLFLQYHNANSTNTISSVPSTNNPHTNHTIPKSKNIPTYYIPQPLTTQSPQIASTSQLIKKGILDFEQDNKSMNVSDLVSFVGIQSVNNKDVLIGNGNSQGKEVKNGKKENSTVFNQSKIQDVLNGGNSRVIDNVWMKGEAGQNYQVGVGINGKLQMQGAVTNQVISQFLHSQQQKSFKIPQPVSLPKQVSKPQNQTIKANTTTSPSQSNMPINPNYNSSNISIVSTPSSPSITPTPSHTDYSKLLSPQSLDNLIQQIPDNIKLIFTQINKISTTDSLTCQQRSSYLYYLLGRIYSAISIKTYQMQQLQYLQRKVENASNSVLFQMSQTKLIQTNINTQIISQKLRLDLFNISQLFTQFSNLNKTMDNHQQQNKLNQQKISLEKQYNISSIQYDSKYKQYDRTNNTINKLIQEFKKIKKLKQQQLLVYNEHINLQANIQVIINENNVKISLLEKQIQGINNLGKNAVVLQAQAEQLLNRLNQLTINRSKLDVQLLAVIKQFQPENKKLDTLNQQLKKIKGIIREYQTFLKTQRNAADTNYFKCFNIFSSMLNPKDIPSDYIMLKSGDLKYHIENYFAVKPDWNKSKLPKTFTNFKSISINSDSWRQSFMPTNQNATTIIQNQNKYNFSCLNTNKEEKGISTITQIGSNYLLVKNTNKNVTNTIRLNLSLCTYMLGMDSLPTGAQLVVWKGLPVSSQQFNISQVIFI